MKHQSDDESLFGIAPGTNTWSQARRLRFIDYRLRWDGRFNRKDLETFFDISPQQATNDVAAYNDGDHENMRYEPKLKTFVATRWFRPLYPSSASKYYLGQLLSIAAGESDAADSFVGWRPEVATVPALGRQIDGDALALLLKAIREKRMVNARIASDAQDGPTFRVFSPHGLAHDGMRWYARAFDHVRKNFHDVGLASVIELTVGEPSPVAFSEDLPWHTELDIRIAPRDGLEAERRRSLEAEYGMAAGALVLRCRHSMLCYTLSNLQLLKSDRPDLVLSNRSELQPYVQMLHSQSA